MDSLLKSFSPFLHPCCCFYCMFPLFTDLFSWDPSVVYLYMLPCSRHYFTLCCSRPYMSGLSGTCYSKWNHLLKTMNLTNSNLRFLLQTSSRHLCELLHNHLDQHQFVMLMEGCFFGCDKGKLHMNCYERFEKILLHKTLVNTFLDPISWVQINRWQDSREHTT